MSRVPAPLLLFFLLAGPASAQMTGGASDPQPAGGRPDSTRVGAMELLRGAGDAFVGLFQSDADDRDWDRDDGPRGLVMTFLAAMDRVELGQEDQLDRATATLSPNYIEVSEFRELKGPAADALFDAFNRLPKISPSSLPDAGKCRRENITRWELFPRGIDSDWAYAALGDASPAGSIVLEQIDGRWWFDRETVLGAEDLAESLSPIPPRTREDVRGAVFVRAVTPVFTDSPWWAWFAAALGLAVGFFAAWLAGRLLNRAADAVSHDGSRLQKLGGNVMAPVLRSLAVPVGLVCVVAGLLAGSAPLALTPTLENARWRLAELLLVVAVGWLIVAAIELAILGVRRAAFAGDDQYAKMGTTVLRRAVRLIAGVVLALFVVQNLFSWDITAVLGGVGLIALALSLAAKDAVANLFGGAMIFGTRPFLVGDWVSFKGKWGEIADVSLQATRIRLLTGEMWSVPNSNFVDEPVTNLSLRKFLRRVFDVRLPLDTRPAKIAEARRILEDVLTSEPVVGDGKGNLEERPPKVNFEAVGEYFFNLRADYWYLMHPDEQAAQRDTDRGWFSYLAHCDAVNTAVVERFRAAGIRFALPATAVYEAEDDAKLAAAADVG